MNTFLPSVAARSGGLFRPGGATLGQSQIVYVTNPRSAHLATEAMLDRTLIAMSSDLNEDADAVTGFVQSIEEAADAMPRQWRITILEADSQRSMVVLFLRP